MAPRCENSTCGRGLTTFNRSKDNPTYCFECGNWVYAFRPDQTDQDWFLVDETRPRADMIVRGGQCERCGLNEYEIDQVSRYGFDAVCRGQVSDGEWIPGCGARHPVRPKMAYEVIWPEP